MTSRRENPLNLTSARLLDDLHDATAALNQARNDADAAEVEWRDIIRKALAAGQRVVDVAAAAGISRERVYQIRDNRRR